MVEVILSVCIGYGVGAWVVLQLERVMERSRKRRFERLLQRVDAQVAEFHRNLRRRANA